MSTTPPGRPGRGQPDWLWAKYARQPVDPQVGRGADRTIAILATQRLPRHIGPHKDPERARLLKNALYDAHQRWNRTHPDDQISLSANVTNPNDGKCYARGQCRCEQNDCKPTPPGFIAIHARVRSKAEGRAHQGAKPRTAAVWAGECWAVEAELTRKTIARPVVARAWDAIGALGARVEIRDLPAGAELPRARLSPAGWRARGSPEAGLSRAGLSRAGSAGAGSARADRAGPRT